MKTKQEYIDALNRMVEVYDNLDGCMSAINIFNEGVHLLEGLVNEHFEEKQETNLDHYFEDLLKTGGRYAFVNGKIKHCWNTRCCDCAFKDENCHGEKIKWLASPYEKQTYKLTQFEYDLLQHFSVDFKFKEMGLLKEMKEKGHFKNINGDELIKDILESCEVIK
jgi:hypothetical protein